MASSRAFAATLMVISGALAGCGTSDGELRGEASSIGAAARTDEVRVPRSGGGSGRCDPGEHPLRLGDGRVARMRVTPGSSNEVEGADPDISRSRRIAARRAVRLPRSVGAARSRPARARIPRKHVECPPRPRGSRSGNGQPRARRDLETLPDRSPASRRRRVLRRRDTCALDRAPERWHLPLGHGSLARRLARRRASGEPAYVHRTRNR